VETLYFARRPFPYGPHPIEDFLDQHQVFKLNGQRNDEPLVRLGFCALLPPGAQIHACGHCQATFSSAMGLETHGVKRHPRNGHAAGPTIVDDRGAPRSPEALERETAATTPAHDLVRALEAKARMEERRLDEMAPLYMDKTKASIAAGEGVYEMQPAVDAPAAKPEKAKGRGRAARGARGATKKRRTP